MYFHSDDLSGCNPSLGVGYTHPAQVEVRPTAERLLCGLEHGFSLAQTRARMIIGESKGEAQGGIDAAARGEDLQGAGGQISRLSDLSLDNNFGGSVEAEHYPSMAVVFLSRAECRRIARSGLDRERFDPACRWYTHKVRRVRAGIVFDR